MSSGLDPSGVAPLQRVADALSRGAAAAAARKLDGALDALLVAWRAHPLAEIARVIESAPPAAPPADISGKRKVAKQAWLALAAERDARALPALLDTLCDVSAPDAEPRLAALAAFAPDPRLDRAMLAILAEPPYTWYGSRKFFYAVLDLAREARDERAPALAADAQRGLVRFSDKMRQPIGRRLDAVVAALTERAAVTLAPLAPAERADLVAIADAFAAARQSSAGDADAADGEALLAAVFADPDDAAARAVYADWLQQRGHPHGELIALQLRAERSRPARARVRELLRDQRRALLGPLADVVKNTRLRFERGFVARCTIDPAESRLLGSPWWATVRELDGGAPELVCHPVLRRLRSLVVYSPCLGDIARVDPPPWELVELRCHLAWGGYETLGEPPTWRGDLRRLARTDRLPHLRVLAIRSDRFAVEPAAYAPLFDGPLAARLERLWLRCTTAGYLAGMALARRTLGDWLAELRRMRPATPLLELEDGYDACPTVYRFARDADDGVHRLVSVVARYPRDEPVRQYAEMLCAALTTLAPDDVAELDVNFALAKADAPSRAAIERAAARFPRVANVAIT